MTDDARDVRAAQAANDDPANAALVRGAHEAFARLYDRHAPVVRALCRRHSPTESEADDALQETFIRAWRMLDRVDAPDRFRTWVYAVARNVCSERRRAGARRAHHEHDAARDHAMNHAALASSPTADGVAPEVGAQHAESMARLTRALDELPDDERLAVHLYYLESDPVTAARESLGLSRSAFYKLLARARERLGALIGQVQP